MISASFLTDRLTDWKKKLIKGHLPLLSQVHDYMYTHTCTLNGVSISLCIQCVVYLYIDSIDCLHAYFWYAGNYTTHIMHDWYTYICWVTPLHYGMPEQLKCSLHFACLTCWHKLLEFLEHVATRGVHRKHTMHGTSVAVTIYHVQTVPHLGHRTWQCKKSWIWSQWRLVCALLTILIR